MRSATPHLVTPTNGMRVRAGASGVLATAVDFGAMAILLKVLNMPLAFAAAAALISSGLGAVTNFLVNKYWAFRDRTPIHPVQVTAYAAVSLTTAVVVAAFVHGLVHLGHLDPLLAKAVAALVAFFIWTYPAQARFVFPVEGKAPRWVMRMHAARVRRT